MDSRPLAWGRLYVLFGNSRQSAGPCWQDGVDSFLEECVVRRELSDNYCLYTPKYDTLDACYDWARDTLNKHASDEREYIYTR